MAIDYHAAIALGRKNLYAKWPERGEFNRLEPVALPSFDAGIRLAPGAKVMTMGSCFARNIEEYFAGQGFYMPVMAYDAPAAEYGEGGRIQGILNKYTLASIAEEIDWLVMVKAEGGKVTWENVAPMMLEIGEDQVLDLQLSTDVPVSRSRAVERRQQIYDIHVQIFECDLAVLTPGLTETWLDRKTGLHIQRMPSPRHAKAEPDRFAFEVMDFFQCFEMLERVVDRLKSHGTAQLAMTVSPVPLWRTMTDKDILIANTYSKSTLRSAIGLLCDRDEFVRYVPSYEKVMLSKDSSVWRDDLRHVSDEFVGNIATAFAVSTGIRLNKVSGDAALFNAAFAADDMEEATKVLDRMAERANEVGVFSFHRNAGKLLFKAERYQDALPHAEQLQRLRPRTLHGYKMEYRIRKAMGNKAAAQEAINRAVENIEGMSRETFLASSKQQ